MFIFTFFSSAGETNADCPSRRRRLEFLRRFRCLFPCFRRKILPLPVTLNLLATPLRVLALPATLAIAGRFYASVANLQRISPEDAHHCAIFLSEISQHARIHRLRCLPIIHLKPRYLIPCDVKNVAMPPLQFEGKGAGSAGDSQFTSGLFILPRIHREDDAFVVGHL